MEWAIPGALQAQLVSHGLLAMQRPKSHTWPGSASVGYSVTTALVGERPGHELVHRVNDPHEGSVGFDEEDHSSSMPVMSPALSRTTFFLP